MPISGTTAVGEFKLNVQPVYADRSTARSEHDEQLILRTDEENSDRVVLTISGRKFKVNRSVLSRAVRGLDLCVE